MIENSYYEKKFNHDGQVVSENNKIISPAKTGVHASIYIFGEEIKIDRKVFLNEKI